MWRYGKCLQKGLGVDRDVKEAARYFKALADKDNRKGMILYGKCLQKGLGVEKDEQAGAIYILRGRACPVIARLGYFMCPPQDEEPIHFPTLSK